LYVYCPFVAVSSHEQNSRFKYQTEIQAMCYTFGSGSFFFFFFFCTMGLTYFRRRRAQHAPVHVRAHRGHCEAAHRVAGIWLFFSFSQSDLGMIGLMRACATQTVDATQVTQRRGSRFMNIDDVMFTLRHDETTISRIIDFLSWKEVRRNLKQASNNTADDTEVVADEEEGARFEIQPCADGFPPQEN